MSSFEEREQMLIDKLSTTDPLGQVAQVAKHLPQQEAAKILKYATSSGDAPDVVAANLKAYDKDSIGSTDWENALKDAPRTKTFLSTPLPLAIVQNGENASVLAGMETENKVWSSFKDGLRDVGRTTLRFGQGALEGMLSATDTQNPTTPPTASEEYLGTRLPDNYMEWAKQTQHPVAQDVATALKEAADSKLLTPKNVQADTTLGQYGLDVIRMLPQIAAQMAVGAAAGPATALGFMGSQIAGSDYENYTKEGVDPGRAMTAALGDAALQAPLEAVGLGKIMRKVPAATPVRERVKQYIEGGLTEAVTEWLQQYPQGAADIYAKGEGKTPQQMGQQFIEDFWKNTQEGLYQGAVALPLGVLGGAVRNAMQRQATKAYVENVEALQTQLAGSAILSQSPELVEQHLEAITGGEKAYIDPDALVMYQMENPKALEELGLTEQQVNAALETGEMIEVTKAQYVTAAAQDPALHEALKNDIAPSTEGLTQRRIDERKNESDVKRATEKTTEEAKAVKDWSKEYSQQLKEAGLSDDMAKQVIVGLQAHARTMSDKPAAWLRENAPEFRQGSMEQPGALQQAAQQVNTETPEFKKWFGDSKAVDKQGKPLVVYHGTNAEFDKFNPARMEDTDGFFFTPEKRVAKAYGGKQLATYLSLNNPLQVTAREWLSGEVPSREEARAQGHDGYVIKGDKGVSGMRTDTYVAFSPEQIKSVNNSGAFDPNNPNIYKQQDLPVMANGSIHWENGRAIITMMQTGNPTTVIHEMVGHFFFQNLVERAAQDDAPEQVKKDVKTLFEWAGYEGKTFDKLTREERTDLHEKVARAAEAYVMEGKAPSVATQSLFRRFAEWMKQVYLSVRELGVQVTPEVAQVFDRMLATDAEIAEMEALERYHESLPGTFLATLNDRQRAHLDQELLKVRAEAEEQLRSRLMPLISEDERQRMAEERAAATERIIEQVKGEPIYRLESSITEAFKKPARGIAKRYKEGKLTQDQEAEFDFIANTMNYTSGDEMATHLIEANTAEKEIASRVDRYMKETFPDPMASKASLQEEAREAMYSDGGAALLATELQLIQEKMGKVLKAEDARQAAATAREASKRTAQTMLAKRELNDATRLQSYIAAERRAAVDTAKYLKAKDYENAAAAKERQLINHALIQESLRIRREAERIKKYLNKQRKAKNWLSDTEDEAGLRVRTNEYRDQAASILARFGYVRKDFSEPTETLAEWVKRQEADEVNGEIINIAPWLAYDNRRSTTGKLTLEELQDVENAIRNIKKMATIGVNSDGFAFINGDGKEATVQTLLDSSAKLKAKQVDKIEKEKSSWIKDMFAGMKQGHRMLEALDAFKSFGPWYQTFYDSMKRAADFRSQLLQRVTDRLEAAFTSEGITKAERYRMAHKQIYVREWGQSVTKNTLLAIALNMGNQGNLDRLTATRLIGVSMATKWDVESIKTVLERHLTAADFRLVGKIWKAIDVYDEYNSMVNRMTGNNLPKVEPLPIVFRPLGGEEIKLDGGYYPLSQDTRGSKQAELNAEKKLGETPGLMPYPSTGRSKSRTQGAKYAIDTDLANLYGNMTDIVQDIAFRPLAHDINKLMRDERVVSTIREKLGDPAYRALLEWERRITSGRAENVKHPLDQFFTWARSATVISSLLLRPGVAVQNVANIMLYGNSVEGWTNRDAAAAYLRHGWGDYIPNALANSERAKALREYVYSKSVQMRDKKNAPDFSFREINDAGQQENLLMRSGNETVQALGYKAARAQESLNKFSSDVFAWTDQLTDIPIWLGAYEKAKASGKTETQAVNFADAIIRNSTGTGRNLDTAWMQAAGSPAMRLFTMFQTFMNTAYNRWAMEANVFLQEKDAARLIKFVAGQYLAFGVLSAFLSFHVPDEDEEWDEWFRKEVLEWPLGMIPLFGGLSKIMLDKAQGFKTYSYRMTPIASKAEDVLKLAGTAEKVWQGQKDAGDLVEPTAALASFFLRYPDQLNDWFFNAYDVLSGNMQPELRDLVKRRPKKERM